MIRPKLLLESALIGAARYRRDRDLGPALWGLEGSERSPLETLAEAEAACEAARRGRAPDYRPARHVALLSAYLAERAAQTKASGSSALRRATKSASASAVAGSSAGA